MTLDFMGWYILALHAPVMPCDMQSVKPCHQSLVTNRQVIAYQLTVYSYDQRFCWHYGL